MSLFAVSHVYDHAMAHDELFALIAAERRRAAGMFESLDDEQLATQSLCREWTVRDVAAHLISPFSISIPRFVLGAVTSGGFHRFSVKLTRRLAQQPVADIVASLRANADSRFSPPGTGPGAPLAEVCVHTRDVAQPLGLDVSAGLPAWRGALEFLTSARANAGFVARGRLNGIRLEATDQEWSHGRGLVLAGPSEALALAVTGREVALQDLHGDGVDLLRPRLR